MSDGERLWAVRYASGGTRAVVVRFHRRRTRSASCIPTTRACSALSPDDRLIVSEPFSDLPGLWQEIEPSTAVTVRRGGVLEHQPFRPRAEGPPQFAGGLRMGSPAVRKWLPMLILASAQFVMVLDSSVMNVAISQIVDDLDTTIQGVQTAITLYTLVMAAFMLLGAKLGDILGRNRAFAIGLAIYGVGSLTTALSPNLAVLLVGWSGVEGFGAVLVVPAIAALTAATYEGRDRALAYALLGGIAAVAIAAGPLIGGWVTTEFSWRYVFAAETVVVIGILLLRGQIARAPAPSGVRSSTSSAWCSPRPAWA